MKPLRARWLWLVVLAIALGTLVDSPPRSFDCWEDEVVVEIVHDPYDAVEARFGCVPADDLPVQGYRP